MSKKLFSSKDIEILSKNKYVKKVSEKGITYTDEFKRLFIAENEKGKFRRNGVEQLQDTRKFNTGRPTEKDLSLEEKYEKLQAKLKLLQAENELLKKLEMLERGMK